MGMKNVTMGIQIKLNESITMDAIMIAKLRICLHAHLLKEKDLNVQ